MGGGGGGGDDDDDDDDDWLVDVDIFFVCMTHCWQ